MIEIRHTDMSANLGSDWIAVDAIGNILTRASTEEACKRAAPDAAEYHSAKTLNGPSDSAGVDYKAAEAAVPPVEDAPKPIGSGVDTLHLGPKDVTDPAPAPAPAPAEVKSTAPQDAGLGQASEPPYAPSPLATTPTDPADGSAFDHDGDHKVGGSRKRKPAFDK